MQLKTIERLELDLKSTQSKHTDDVSQLSAMVQKIRIENAELKESNLKF
jgi:hypothetical protein